MVRHRDKRSGRCEGSHTRETRGSNAGRNGGVEKEIRDTEVFREKEIRYEGTHRESGSETDSRVRSEAGAGQQLHSNESRQPDYLGEGRDMEEKGRDLPSAVQDRRRNDSRERGKAWSEEKEQELRRLLQEREELEERKRQVKRDQKPHALESNGLEDDGLAVLHSKRGNSAAFVISQSGSKPGKRDRLVEQQDNHDSDIAVKRDAQTRLSASRLKHALARVHSANQKGGKGGTTTVSEERQGSEVFLGVADRTRPADKRSTSPILASANQDDQSGIDEYTSSDMSTSVGSLLSIHNRAEIIKHAAAILVSADKDNSDNGS